MRISYWRSDLLSSYLFFHTDPRSALILLARSARRGSWPVPPWYAALCFRNDKGVWNEAGTSLAARVLQRMPLEDMSRIALQAAQWLEANFDILPQPTDRKRVV